MTKAKARLRAKANTARKAKKRQADTDHAGQQTHPGRFDPGASSIKGPLMNANTKSLAGTKRGATRSR